MPKFTKKTDDKRTVEHETSNPREIADLKARGFSEVKPKAAAPKSDAK
jgi:hypothetical protein